MLACQLDPELARELAAKSARELARELGIQSESDRELAREWAVWCKSEIVWSLGRRLRCPAAPSPQSGHAASWHHRKHPTVPTR